MGLLGTQAYKTSPRRHGSSTRATFRNPRRVTRRSRTATTTIACILAVTWLLSAGAVLAYQIESHRWQDRLLAIVAPTAELDAVQHVLTTVKARAPAMRERRLRVLELYADTARIDGTPLPSGSAADLRATLRVAADERQLLLIGLDGGIKRATSLATPLSDLLAEIDAMPMRRQEIRERRAAGLPVTPP